MLYFELCIIMSTKKIVGVSTVSRSDHGVAQTRELVCTKFVLPQAIARGKFCYSCVCNVSETVNRSQCCGGGS